MPPPVIKAKRRIAPARSMCESEFRVPMNSYCVQYMGVNDDKLEVLTRRVPMDQLMFDKISFLAPKPRPKPKRKSPPKPRNV